MKMTNKKIVIQVLGIHLLLAFLSFIIFLINRFRQTDHAC